MNSTIQHISIEECGPLDGVMAEKKEKENWYLPYMDKKTKGIEVEERKNPVAVFYCAGASNVGQATVVCSVRAADELGYEKAARSCSPPISNRARNPPTTKEHPRRSGDVASQVWDQPHDAPNPALYGRGDGALQPLQLKGEGKTCL